MSISVCASICMPVTLSFDYFLWLCSARSRCVSMVTKRCCGNLDNKPKIYYYLDIQDSVLRYFVITCKLIKTSVLCKLYQGWPNSLVYFQTGNAGYEWIH